MFLPRFDVFCVLLLNRRTATWNLFVLYNNKRPRGLYADDFFQVLRDIIGFCGKSEAR